MTDYESHKQEPWFSLIANREKSIEGRLKKGKYAKIKSGDCLIVFSSNDRDSIKAEVLAVRYYSSFYDMLEHEEMKKIIPGLDDIKTGVEIYRKFYSQDDEKQFGVVAIEIEIVK